MKASKSLNSASQTTLDAQCLANQINMYFLGDDAAFQVVHDFNHKPQSFNHQVCYVFLSLAELPDPSRPA